MAKTPSRSAQLARDLLGRIARRELRPGDPIDVQALGRRHGVSRTVVREALADLGGKGLVVARPKVGTTVAAETDWNLLDPTLVAVAIAEPGPESMLPEATELRRLIEPALAADAARDAGRPLQQAILQAVRALADAVGAADADRFRDAGLAVHAAVTAACGNRLLRSIDHALVPVRAQQLERLAAAQLRGDAPGTDVLRTLTLQTALGLAIARREPSIAAAHAHALASIAAAPAPAASAPARDDAAAPFPDMPALREMPTFVPEMPAPRAAASDWTGDAAASLQADEILGGTEAPAATDTPAITAATDRDGPVAAPGAETDPRSTGRAPTPRTALDPRLLAADTPAEAPYAPGGPSDAGGPPAHIDVEIADDWPPTETLVRDGSPLAPLRRASLEPDDAPPPFAVPALLGEPPHDPSRRATLR